MPPQDPPARMPPIRPDEIGPETRAFLDKWSGGFFQDADRHPVLLTLAHNPRLADVFSAFNIHVLTTSTLPVKERQIAIMRLAWLTKATFMWSSHLNTSVLCGLDPEMYEPIKVGASDPYFTPFEREVILATEELIATSTLSDATWAALSAVWDKAQMLDFLFAIGCYMTVAYVMKATAIPRMPDLLALADKYGAPE
ncbi:alkylhydroperoxidase family enzyme [Novosphingobium chloroacetimidivorans]|uniref:Alkylhydroperoxidase family enzyme n=1 Tax=Novosphingobium chloroacetimidivorans TaxID=1428314 RepID=A0A7W7NUM7_9SPHN|nr:carboxymuconolactone decarboxylase family protein [Novosphingobium chloroacetimidivorans]MBB4857663.1 alkylhydroperoxidase family enzyme [Novosphingobium chloroacetimidivorans]